MNYHKLIILTFIILSSCGKSKEDDTEKSSLIFRVPARSQSFFPLTASSDPMANFAYETPTSISEIDCYGVLVSYSGSAAGVDTNGNNCFDASGSDIRNPKRLVGFVSPGSELSLELSSGSARTFEIIGFGSDTSCPSTNDSQMPNRLNMSPIMILGSKTVDLLPGEQDIVLNLSIAGASEFMGCEGPGVGWGSIARFDKSNFDQAVFND